MRVALLHAPFAEAEAVGGSRSIRRVLNVIPPLGIASLAAVLERDGHEVRLFDCTIGRAQDESWVLSELGRYGAEFVGFSATTPSFGAARRLARAVRKLLPEAPLVIGGAHATAAPEHALADGAFDAAVLGEGETTVVELCRHLAQQGLAGLDRIAGLALRVDGSVRRTPPRPPVEDLDELPFPARHLLPPLSAYHPTPASYRALPVGVLMTSRGCPFRCTFCDRAVFGNRCRMHSPERVVEEVRQLVHRYGAREIRFFDDTFTLNRRRVLELCERLRLAGLRLPWTCLTAVRAVTPELLRAMRLAGCWQVLYGLESGDAAMLRRLGKGNTVELNEQAVRWAKEAGMSVRADFIVGTPGETRESLRRTVAFAKRLPLDYAHFNKFIPFPGTALSDELAQQGYSFDFDRPCSIVDHTAVMVTPKGMTPTEFTDFLDRANKEFYLRPGYLVRRALSVRTLTELRGQVQGCFAICEL
jgi:radical SAM superfamily enzyme YgiQ (UPF0313 family)